MTTHPLNKWLYYDEVDVLLISNRLLPSPLSDTRITLTDAVYMYLSPSSFVWEKNGWTNSSSICSVWFFHCSTQFFERRLGCYSFSLVFSQGTSSSSSTVSVTEMLRVDFIFPVLILVNLWWFLIYKYSKDNMKIIPLMLVTLHDLCHLRRPDTHQIRPIPFRTCVGIRHRHLWLDWITSFSQIITGVDVSVFMFVVCVHAS
jgi:hypothetical protein